ncbi:Pre-mRNA-processing factor 39 [Hordeum vulgare]|nr:Pre-mRNA-processing factor 39 [Hordeum vulgare]
MHAEEVSRRRRQLALEQRLNPVYAADSLHWEVWFAVEHEEQRQRGMHNVQIGGPPQPLPVVSDEDQEVKAAYQAAPAAALRESEEEDRRKAEEEDAVYEEKFAKAIALPAAGDCVMPPPPKTEPTEPQREVYQWTGCLRECVSAPPIWLSVTPQQEDGYL